MITGARSAHQKIVAYASPRAPPSWCFESDVPSTNEILNSVNFKQQQSGNHRFSKRKIAAVAFHNCARTQAPCQNGSERGTPCEKQLTQAPHFLNIFKRGRVLPYVSLLKFSKMFSKIIRGGDLRICTASHARISKNV